MLWVFIFQFIFKKIYVNIVGYEFKTKLFLYDRNNWDCQYFEFSLFTLFAVETLKNEKQTSYPKAGLILRTSSFKENGHQTLDQDETSPGIDNFFIVIFETWKNNACWRKKILSNPYSPFLLSAERECESVTVRTTSTSKTVSGGETFLTNKSRVSGVRDVISRMKTEEHREGDTAEDVEARDLLNKFIGSQVILSGVESRTSTTSTEENATAAPTSSVKRTTKITTTVTVSQHYFQKGFINPFIRDFSLRILHRK